MTKKHAPKKVNKSADTGRFVSNEELKKHPKTTYQQTANPKKKRVKKSG